MLVGRMEIMSPADEQRLIDAVAKSSLERAAYSKKPTEYRKKNAFPVSDPILSFGRMTEPALVRIAKIADKQDVRLEAERLIRQTRSAGR